ncbi:MAG: hypothetical protein LBN42_03930 [Oscillospiraceae bacterium]|jgi:hypothetical protein|nr:hypothetical protein [Oscillospiraceae bacterium]
MVGDMLPILRRGTKEDLRIFDKRQREAMAMLDEFVPVMKRDGIKLLAVRISLDGGYVSANIVLPNNAKIDEAIDRDLHIKYPRFSTFRVVCNPREEARIAGGCGVCGKPYCCSQGICSRLVGNGRKAAERQGLNAYSGKCLGGCGQFMCCLGYEAELYENISKVTPKLGERVETPMGFGRTIYANGITGIVRVALEMDRNDRNNDRNSANAPDKKKPTFGYSNMPKFWDGKVSDVKRIPKAAPIIDINSHPPVNVTVPKLKPLPIPDFTESIAKKKQDVIIDKPPVQPPPPPHTAMKLAEVVIAEVDSAPKLPNDFPKQRAHIPQANVPNIANIPNTAAPPKKKKAALLPNGKIPI